MTRDNPLSWRESDFELTRKSAMKNWRTKIIATFGNKSSRRSKQRTSVDVLNDQLVQACINCDVIAAKRALDQGANVNYQNADQETPLLTAVESGRLDLVALLCSQPNIVFDTRSSYGATALHIAILTGNREMTKELLRSGASPECRDNFGRRPLHVASFKKDISSAEILLAHDARVNVYDTFSESPLHYSVMSRRCIPMAHLLLINGVNEVLLRCWGRSSAYPPLNDIGLGPLLETVLHARSISDFQAVETLILFGGDVNVTDPVGWRTPLHLVAINGQLKMAEYLIAHGADLYARNRAGQTPLDVAVSYGNLKIACLIEESRHGEKAGHSADTS